MSDPRRVLIESEEYENGFTAGKMLVLATCRAELEMAFLKSGLDTDTVCRAMKVVRDALRRTEGGPGS